MTSASEGIKEEETNNTRLKKLKSCNAGCNKWSSVAYRSP